MTHVTSPRLVSKRPRDSSASICRVRRTAPSSADSRSRAVAASS